MLFFERRFSTDSSGGSSARHTCDPDLKHGCTSVESLFGTNLSTNACGVLRSAAYEICNSKDTMEIKRQSSAKTQRSGQYIVTTLSTLPRRHWHMCQYHLNAILSIQGANRNAPPMQHPSEIFSCRSMLLHKPTTISLTTSHPPPERYSLSRIICEHYLQQQWAIMR